MAVIGVAADRETLQCVLTSSGIVLWSRVVPITSDLATALDTALAHLPPAGRRARVTVAVDARWAQLRLLRELPRAKDRLVRQAIMGSSARYFLGKGVPLVTTMVQWTGDAEGWCAAFEQPIVEQLVARCEAAGVTLEAVVPLAVVAASAGDAPSGCAAAVAAAAVTRREPLAFRPVRRQRRASTREFAFAAAAALLSSTLLIAAPGMAGARAALNARSELAVLEQSNDRARVLAEERELAQLQSRALVLSTFGAGARSLTAFVSQIAAAMPKSSFLVTLRTDSAGGSAIAIGARPEDVIRAIQLASGIAAVDVAGPITREDVLGQPRQRLTIRFSWAASVPTRTPPRVASR